MPKTKSGEQIDWKEFGKRWKQGIVAISPFQQARMTYFNTFIILFGVLAGLVVTLFNLENLWWLSVILVGALGNTVIIQIGNYQKYKLLKMLSHKYKEVN